MSNKTFTKISFNGMFALNIILMILGIIFRNQDSGVIYTCAGIVGFTVIISAQYVISHLKS